MKRPIRDITFTAAVKVSEGGGYAAFLVKLRYMPKAVVTTVEVKQILSDLS